MQAGTRISVIAIFLALTGAPVLMRANGYDVIFHSSYEVVADVPASDAEAARFLTQATFGPSRAEIARLRGIGYTQWFEQQFSMPTSSSLGFLQSLTGQGIEVSQSNRLDGWFWTAVFGQDQLRQRMAFALSEIFVASDQDANLSGQALGMAHYADLLADGAFGNYRELLENVTLSPEMGNYLTYLRNTKANTANNTSPDENYGREVMQLFSIGLVQRNIDFSPILSGGQPIPSYDQSAVTGMSAVFTGFTYGNSSNFGTGSDFLSPMMCFFSYHEDAAKQIFPFQSGMTQTLPAGQGCYVDLEDTLDALASHPNVAPFISRQLIQHFTTSNPSPAYISRVATVFNSSGGDFTAVLKAILMDSEARGTPAATFGKMREPLLRVTALWRAVPTTALAYEGMGFNNNTNDYGQRPLGSPSVFNFFSPDYQQPNGKIAQNLLLSPEFQIITDTTLITAANSLYDRTWSSYVGMTNPPTNRPLIDTSILAGMAGNPATLLNELNIRLMYGTMSPGMNTILTTMLTSMATVTPTQHVAATPQQLVLAALHLILISPEFAVQH